jgi:peptidoglycan/LPS O-acetylase OafA/YrhL
MKKILPLQSLRAICVIIVMIVHFNPYQGAFFHNSFLAATGVFTFLVLSGFIISKVYHNKILNIKQLFEFYRKRFFRMYPLHLLFLIIFLIVEFLRLYIETNYLISVNSEAFTINNLKTFFSHFFLINIFNNVLTFNAPAWTVSGEFLASIFFGIVSIFFLKDSKKFNFLLLSTFIIVIIFLFFEKKLTQYNTIFALLSVIFCFIIGFFCFRIQQSRNKLFFTLLNKNIQILNLILFIILINFKILDFLVPICSGIIIIYLSDIKKNNFFEKIFFNNFLIYTGKISYTLYISHYFVYWVYTQVFRHVLKIESLDSFNNTLFIENNLIIYLTKIFLSFITVYFISHILYNKFEKRFI